MRSIQIYFLSWDENLQKHFHSYQGGTDKVISAFTSDAASGVLVGRIKVESIHVQKIFS